MSKAAEKNKEKREAPIPVGQIPLDHPQMAPFRKVPSRKSVQFRVQWPVLLPFMASIGLCLVLFEAKILPETGWFSGVVVISFVALGIWLTMVVSRIVVARSMLLVREADDIDLGQPPSDSRYVGVAYADGMWQFQDDTSWDRGFLMKESGCLIFGGLGSSFLLPLDKIERVVVRKSVKSLSGQLTRIFLDWRDENNQLNTLSLEVRDAGDSSKVESKTLELANWLRAEAKKSAPFPLPPPEKLPFRSVLLDFNRIPSLQTIRLSDRVLGALAFLVCVVAVTAIAALVHVSPGYLGGVSAILGFGCYHAVVLHRVRSRVPNKKGASVQGAAG
jgi:hypothetical protein